MLEYSWFVDDYDNREPPLRPTMRERLEEQPVRELHDRSLTFLIR